MLLWQRVFRAEPADSALDFALSSVSGVTGRRTKRSPIQSWRLAITMSDGIKKINHTNTAERRSGLMAVRGRKNKKDSIQSKSTVMFCLSLCPFI